MMKLLSKGLRDLANRIDSGNTYLTEEEQMKLIGVIKDMDKEKPMSKYQAFHYIGVSRATFDNLVKEDRIPKGSKQQGFTELCWYQKDLDKYIKEVRNQLKKK